MAYNIVSVGGPIQSVSFNSDAETKLAPYYAGLKRDLDGAINVLTSAIVPDVSIEYTNNRLTGWCTVTLGATEDNTAKPINVSCSKNTGFLSRNCKIYLKYGTNTTEGFIYVTQEKELLNSVTILYGNIFCSPHALDGSLTNKLTCGILWSLSMDVDVTAQSNSNTTFTVIVESYEENSTVPKLTARYTFDCFDGYNSGTSRFETNSDGLIPEVFSASNPQTYGAGALINLKNVVSKSVVFYPTGELYSSDKSYKYIIAMPNSLKLFNNTPVRSGYEFIGDTYSTTITKSASSTPSTGSKNVYIMRLTNAYQAVSDNLIFCYVYNRESSFTVSSSVTQALMQDVATAIGNMASDTSDILFYTTLGTSTAGLGLSESPLSGRPTTLSYVNGADFDFTTANRTLGVKGCIPHSIGKSVNETTSGGLHDILLGDTIGVFTVSGYTYTYVGTLKVSAGTSVCYCGKYEY